MAGAMTHVVYTDDTGTAYRMRIAQWVATLTGATAATTEPNPPKGLRPRRRYARITATGREQAIVIPDVGATQWTAAEGTAVTLETGVFGSTGVAATLQGRTGERKKAI
jgi:thiamine pyrophosphate-dependent acetolactate synthase large subunit-like protein